MEGFTSALLEARQEARQRAITTLERHPSAVKNGFISVHDLAEMEGIKVLEEDFEDGTVAGFIQIKTSLGSPVIVVNKDNPPERQRFTIAHELGHYFLHANQSVHIDDRDTAELVLYRDKQSSEATHIREIQANQYAAELLMPSAMIDGDVSELRKINLGMSEIVVKLAEQYKVSQSAMTIRLSKIA